MEEIGELAIIRGKLDYFPTNHTLPVSQFDAKESISYTVIKELELQMRSWYIFPKKIVPV
jgi:hypothetical protein